MLSGVYAQLIAQICFISSYLFKVKGWRYCADSDCTRNKYHPLLQEAGKVSCAFSFPLDILVSSP